MKKFPINGEKLSDLVLEKFFLGELDEYEMNRVRELIAGNPEIKERLDMIGRSNHEILRDYPPERIVPQIISDYNKEIRKEEDKSAGFTGKLRKYSLVTASSLALFFLLTASFIIINIRQHYVFKNEGIIVKGLTPHLNLYQNRGNEAVLLSNNSILSENDIIQISYIAAGKKYGVIISIDGKGNVNLHYPDFPKGPEKLFPEGEIALQNAYQLDNAPKYEKFYFITSGKPIDTRIVLDAAEKAYRTGDKITLALDLPKNMEQNSITLLKK
jgi:hypothetical protein